MAAADLGARDEGTCDPWSRWILEHRFGGDPAAFARMMPQLREFRDTVLRGARIAPGDVVLDVGCGDGLLGMEALNLVGDAGQVVFSDISRPLLDRCREVVSELGLLDRSEIVETALPDLPEIPAGSVDVAVTRSVLIYVEDRAASFAALHRVLRPGGRLSIFEPINSFTTSRPGQLWGFDVAGLEAVAEKVRQVYRRHQPADNPMVTFDERDLLACAEEAGFEEIAMDYHARIGHDPGVTSWEALVNAAPNPLVPPLREILDQALSDEEQARLRARVEQQLSAGGRRQRLATAYLTATR